MSDDSTNNLRDFDFLGYQLGLIEDAERRRIESAVGEKDALAAQCRAVDAWLAPLAADRFEPPADLAARIEARIEANRRPYLQTAGDTVVKTPFLSGRDLLALAATITLFVGVFLPSYRQARHRAERAACANNLKSLGWATGMYEASNGDYLPFSGSAPKEAVWYRGQQNSAPSSRAPYKLVTGHYVAPDAFIDPGHDGSRPMRHPNPESLDDFPDHRNNSFSFNRRLSQKPWTRYQMSTRTPMVSGMTPLVDTDQRLRAGGAVSKNSPNHAGRGQNVMQADYSVKFHTTSLVGPNDGDDIFRLYGIRDGNYTGHEAPRGATDTFMTP